MKKVVNWSVILLLVLSIFGVVLSGCQAEAPPAPAPAPAPAPKPAPEKVFEIKYGFFSSAKHHLNLNVAEPFIERVNAESKGRIKATNYPGGVLAKLTALYDAVVKGVVDVAMVVPRYTVENFPLTGVIELPFIVPNGPVAVSLLKGPLWDKYLSKEYEKVKVLGMSRTSGYQIMTAKKPVRTLADLKGVKIRAAGGADVALFSALGGTPVKIDAMEQYEGLQRGTIDGTFFPYASIPAYKLQEVVKYVTETNCGGSVFAIIMNKELWESLPRDLQLVIEYASRDSADAFSWSYYNQDAGSKKLIKDAGVEIIIPTAEEMNKMRAASKVVLDKWLEDNEAKGLPAREVYELMLAQPELYGLGK